MATELTCERCKGTGIDPVRVGMPDDPTPCDPEWCDACGGAGSWSDTCERCGSDMDDHDYTECVNIMVEGMRADYDHSGHDLSAEKYLAHELATALRKLDSLERAEDEDE